MNGPMNLTSEPTRATILVADIVDSTAHVLQLGDQAWLELLDRHDDVALEVVTAHDGVIAKHTGDGFIAVFPGAAKALRCGPALRARVGDLGLQIRCGVAHGEVHRRGNDVIGLAVHLAARVQGLAVPGQILATDEALAAGGGGEMVPTRPAGNRVVRGVATEIGLVEVAPASAPATGSPTAVIIDDHSGFRASARALLEADGFDVVATARDGHTGLALIAQLLPTVALIDIQMPDLDGFAVAAAVSELPQPPLLVMTSAREAGAYGDRLGRLRLRYVSKVDLLSTSIRTYLHETRDDADPPSTDAVEHAEVTDCTNAPRPSHIGGPS